MKPSEFNIYNTADRDPKACARCHGDAKPKISIRRGVLICVNCVGELLEGAEPTFTEEYGLVPKLRPL